MAPTTEPHVSTDPSPRVPPKYKIRFRAPLTQKSKFPSQKLPQRPSKSRIQRPLQEPEPDRQADIQQANKPTVSTDTRATELPPKSSWSPFETVQATMEQRPYPAQEAKSIELPRRSNVAVIGPTRKRCTSTELRLKAERAYPWLKRPLPKIEVTEVIDSIEETESPRKTVRTAAHSQASTTRTARKIDARHLLKVPEAVYGEEDTGPLDIHDMLERWHSEKDWSAGW